MKFDVIVCQECDNNLKNYTNVFNKLVIEGYELSFVVVTKVEEEPEDEYQELTLHYFLISENNGGLYLMEVDYKKPNENSKISSFKENFVDIPVPYDGLYTVVIVRNDTMRDCEIEQAEEIVNTGEIVAQTSFEIVRKK